MGVARCFSMQVSFPSHLFQFIVLCVFRLENMTVTMHTKTRLYSKGGFTFYNVTNCRVDFKMDGLKSYFSNLFNGNKQLGK